MKASINPTLEIRHLPHPAPASADIRTALIANPGFGKVFSDHMITIDWEEERGWHDAVIAPRGPLSLDPAAAVFHYAQEIFEGLKAYRLADGSMALFRPEINARRFNASAKRMAMPELPEDIFVEAIMELVRVDSNWFPTFEDGSLYLRPFMIATEAFLGVRSAKRYKFIVIASPVGSYFKSNAAAVSIWVSKYTRAALGGTGAAKCGGNYAASLLPTAEAFQLGHDQTLFLDAVEHRWIEELGGMNIFFIFDNGCLITPPLTGTILPGITRDSLISIAREDGLSVTEEPYSIESWRADAESGRLVEAFACGTAAVVTAIGKVTDSTGTFLIADGMTGELTKRLKDRLVAIQRGVAPDTHGWMLKFGEFKPQEQHFNLR